MAYAIKFCFGKQIKNGSRMIFNHNYNLKPKEKLLIRVEKHQCILKKNLSLWLKI